MTDITELTSVQKNANIHRLSRLIAYTPNDELRKMAVEVEHYTDRLIEALEKAQAKADVYDMLRDDYCLREKGVGLADFVDWQAKRISDLESCTVKLPLPACTYADHSYPAYTKQQVLSLLESLGIIVIEEDM